MKISVLENDFFLSCDFRINVVWIIMKRGLNIDRVKMMINNFIFVIGDSIRSSVRYKKCFSLVPLIIIESCRKRKSKVLIESAIDTGKKGSIKCNVLIPVSTLPVIFYSELKSKKK